MSDQGKPEKKMQLFCIPFAGGSRSAFLKLKQLAADPIEVILLEYPGHEGRMREPFRRTMDELVSDAEEQIAGARRREIPYALLGYSMGSIVAYELLIKLAESGVGAEMPAYVFLCANEALTNYSPRVNFEHMTDEEIIAKLRSLGGFNEKVLSEPRFLQFFLRPIKADYSVLNDYSFRHGRLLPKVGCSVIYSENDTIYEQVAGWRDLIDGQVDYYALGSSHFFIQSEYAKMAEIINEKLLMRV